MDLLINFVLENGNTNNPYCRIEYSRRIYYRGFRVSGCNFLEKVNKTINGLGK